MSIFGWGQSKTLTQDITDHLTQAIRDAVAQAAHEAIKAGVQWGAEQGKVLVASLVEKFKTSQPNVDSKVIEELANKALMEQIIQDQAKKIFHVEEANCGLSKQVAELTDQSSQNTTASTAASAKVSHLEEQLTLVVSAHATQQALTAQQAASLKDKDQLLEQANAKMKQQADQLEALRKAAEAAASIQSKKKDKEPRPSRCCYA